MALKLPKTDENHPFFDMILEFDKELKRELKRTIPKGKKGKDYLEKLKAELELIQNNPEEQEALENHISNCLFKKENGL